MCSAQCAACTHHIDEILESDGRRPALGCLLLQLFDLVRLDVAAEFRRLQHDDKVVPRNFAEALRIELKTPI